LCALAPNYELLLLARLISACGHGVFFGVATVAVSQLVPLERRGAALSLMIGGITVANILGLPAGTAIGNAFGWRMTFVVIAGMAVLAVVAVAIALPARARGEEEADAPLRLQARQLLHQEVWLSYLTIAVALVGQLAFGTFQVAILTEVTRIDPVTMVPLFLLLGGAGAVAGIWLGGRASDWNGPLAMLIVLGGQIVCFGLLLVAAPYPLAMGPMLFLASAFGFGFSTPIQVRVLHGARKAPRLAATLVSSAYNVGIAGGAAVGAALLTAGVGYSLLPVTGLICSAIALGLASISIILSRRGIA
jgi:DHA1 family inner membrane transport protein